MGERAFIVKPESSFSACPKCGNRERFFAHSSQCAEDCCEVWVVCECGHDPTADRPGYRLEDVWGSLDLHTINAAMYVREDLLTGPGDPNG